MIVYPKTLDEHGKRVWKRLVHRVPEPSLLEAYAISYQTMIAASQDSSPAAILNLQKSISAMSALSTKLGIDRKETVLSEEDADLLG